MKPSTLESYTQRMLRVLIHIQKNLDQPLSLENLASIACFSPYHFHRIFRGMIGESIKAHIRRLRLERAAARLKLGELPVTQIAFEAGYETHEAFSRAFKSVWGMSPSGFRAAKNPCTQADSPSGIHYHNSGSPGTIKTQSKGERGMNVCIKKMADQRVAFMRHQGAYDKCGEVWDKLLPRLGKEGLLGPGTVMLGLCHDDPEVTPQEKIRYDACVSVPDTYRPSGEVGVQTIPGGEYAMTTHIGPYKNLGDTYAKLMGQWLPNSGRELRSSPCFEIYMNDPEGTDPEDLITDIYAPLED